MTELEERVRRLEAHVIKMRQNNYDYPIVSDTRPRKSGVRVRTTARSPHKRDKREMLTLHAKRDRDGIFLKENQ